MRRGKRYPNGPVYRTERGGGLVFTADDFPGQGGQGSGSPAGGGGQPAASQQGNPSPPANQPERDPQLDFDVDVVGADGTPAGTIPSGGGQPRRQDQQQDGGAGGEQPNPLDMVLDGDHVPTNLRGKKVSDLVSAIQALDSLPRGGQPGGYGGYNPGYDPNGRASQPEQVQFTEDDFGVTADPAKFQQKLFTMMEQFAGQKLNPLMVQSLATQSMVVAQNARNQLKYYDLFKDEIEADARNQPINITANPLYWQGVHDRLVRENITKVMSHEQTKNPPKPAPGQSERTNGATAQSANPNRSQRPQLTIEELRLCQATGVTPQEYVFYRDRY